MQKRFLHLHSEESELTSSSKKNLKIRSTFQSLSLCDTKKDKMKNPFKLKISLKKQTPTYIIQGGDWCTLSTIVQCTSVGPCEELSFHSQSKKAH